MALHRLSIFTLNHCHRQHSLFQAFFRDPIRADIPLFVDRDIFLQFLPVLQPLWLHWHPTFVKGHGPQAIGCEVHVSLFEQPHFAPGNSLTIS